jgi:hypothetical protein
MRAKSSDPIVGLLFITIWRSISIRHTAWLTPTVATLTSTRENTISRLRITRGPFVLDPKSRRAYNNRGYTYYVKGDYGQAIEDATTALTLDAEYKHAYDTRGRANLATVGF